MIIWKLLTTLIVSVAADPDVLRLVGVEIPFIVFLRNEDSDEGPSININRSVMSDFVGQF